MTSLFYWVNTETRSRWIQTQDMNALMLPKERLTPMRLEDDGVDGGIAVVEGGFAGLLQKVNPGPMQAA
jgi:hypothetical protein